MRILLIITLMLFFSACQKHNKSDYYITYIQSDPARLDPFYSTDVVSGRILTKLFNGLFKINAGGQLVKDLTDDYRFDGRTLELCLKKNVLFHDGSQLTSEDVIFSLNRIRFSSNPTSPRKWILGSIKSIKTSGRHKLKIILKKPSSTFLYILTMPNCYIISKNYYKTHAGVTGSGPFTLSEWESDHRIVLEKNPDYFDGKPEVSGIVYKIISEDLTARFEFLNKTLDYFELPYLSRMNIRKEKISFINIPELSVHYIALNNSKPPFNSKTFRQALNMAVDRDRIMKSLFINRFIKAAGPVPPKIGDYISTVKGISYDPVRAKSIITDMGLQGKEFIIFIKSDHQVSLICQMIQYYLSKAGLNVTIKEMEWSALKASVLKQNFDMAYFTWHADYPEAENFLFPLFYSGNKGAGGNRAYYSNQKVDNLLLKAENTIEGKKRFAIYDKISGIIVDDAPWIFLWYGDKKIALSERVKQFIPYPIYNGMKGNEIKLD
ncbi:MAG: ABC transporter substrate-binding protein [Spirochaetes bacterium]|nr:ABC transporter substrate-binding protein [Spirochaetota bacterium]